MSRGFTKNIEDVHEVLRFYFVSFAENHPIINKEKVINGGSTSAYFYSSNDTQILNMNKGSRKSFHAKKKEIWG